MERSFQHLWEDEEMSDVVLLLVPEGSCAFKDQALASVPAHSVLLSLSPMLRAQILRWDKKKTKASNTNPADQNAAQDQNGDKDSKPQIVLTLQGPEHLTAALTVIKSLYALKPLPELLAELSQVQQLRAAVLADEWQVPEVSAAVVDNFKSCAADSVLTDEAVHELLAMPAHPDCLQPLVKCVLMLKLGDLEAAWADAARREMLLKLSLPLMEQLLSYDDIQVHSEETVLYTAQEYVDKLPQKDQSAAVQKLAPLIRCPHLSAFWLSVSCMSVNASKLLLFSQRTHVQKLLMLRLADQQQPVKPEELQQLLKGAPDSWFLKQRAHRKIESAEMTWELDVEQLKMASILSAAEDRIIHVQTQDTTPPFRGITWTLSVQCNNGKTIGIYMEPKTTLPDLYTRRRFSISMPNRNNPVDFKPPMLAGTTGWGNIGLLPKDMVGGWDDAVWEAAKLPTSGVVPVKLTVTDVAFS